MAKNTPIIGEKIINSNLREINAPSCSCPSKKNKNKAVKNKLK